MFLRRTVEDVLAHAQGDTEVIAVLDGAWADPPLADHPRVQLIYRPQPIGQRAAVNLAARISTAKYVMKLDAHCSVDAGFDLKLMAADQELGRPDVTQIPAQFNLHAFNWRCRACGTETYQGPTPTSCVSCSMGPFERVMYWDLNAGGVNGKHRRTEFWRFDHDLHFQYSGPRLKDQRHAELADVMSSVGACFFMRRSRFVEIGGLDEAHGSWGNFGTEIACKSWLSGGLHIVNRRTWFAHLFRTQGADFGFPYPNPHAAVERARAHSRDIWLNNRWPNQTRPLSWMVDHFSPIRGWHDPEASGETPDQKKTRTRRLSEVLAAGAVFRSVSKRSVVLGPIGRAAQVSCTQPTSPEGPLRADGVGSQRQDMAASTDGAPGIDRTGTATPEQVRAQSCEGDVRGITASGVVADDVVQLRNIPPAAHGDGLDQPGVQVAVREDGDVSGIVEPTERAVSGFQGGAGPIPASGRSVDLDLGKDSPDVVGREMSDRQHTGGVWHAPIVPTKGIVYYSDCRGDARILRAVREQLERAAPSLPIVSVTLTPLAFGRNIVLPLERGQLTMFRQILAGLEALDTDIVFFCEHDVLYSSEHFRFTPPRRDVFYYNQHRWQVSADDGRAVHYRCCQTAQLCADRQLLIEHYRRRVAAVEAAGGYGRNMGFEPGTNGWSRSIDPQWFDTWWTTVPNIDIRHGRNLSKTRWDPSEFRNKSTCQEWSGIKDEVPGWGRTRGRFIEFLAEIGQTISATEGAA